MLFRCYWFSFEKIIIKIEIVVFNGYKDINYDFGNDISVFVKEINIWVI